MPTGLVMVPPDRRTVKEWRAYFLELVDSDGFRSYPQRFGAIVGSLHQMQVAAPSDADFRRSVSRMLAGIEAAEREDRS